MASGFTNEKSQANSRQRSEPKDESQHKKLEDAVHSTIFNIVNCTDVHVGDRHHQSLTIDQAKQILNNSSDEDSVGLTKNELLVFIVRHVLTNGTPAITSSMPIKELERGCDALVESLWSKGTKCFRDVSNWPISQFLDKNNDVFTKSGKGCKTIVRLKKLRSEPTGGNCELSESCDTSLGEEVTEADSDGWTLVSKKGKSKTKQLGLGKQRPEIDSTFPNAQELLVNSLLSKDTNCDLATYESDRYYKDNPNQFMLDVVSMWNTPNRLRSHILLGVKSSDRIGEEHTVVGLEKNSTDQFYQSLYKNEMFSSRPKFKYFEVELDGKTIGVLEVSSSFGCGQPCITQQGSEGLFEVNQLWFRPKTTNTLSSLGDLRTVQIFQWFSGPSGSNETKAFPENSSALIQTEDQNEIEEVSESVNTNLTSFKQFYKTVDSFKKGDYILVSGNVTCTTNYLSSLSEIPWLYIFDLDMYSRSKGLANALEHSLGQQRHLIYGTIDKAPSSISGTGTVWCFVQGMTESADSLKHNHFDAHIWHKSIRKRLIDHCELLAGFADGYTVLTIIVFWPEDETLVPFMNKVIGELDLSIEPSPKIVMCMPKEPQSQEAKALLHVLHDTLKKNLVVVRIGVADICSGIFKLMEGKNLPTKMQHQLPRADDLGECDVISEKDASWLREEMEVLYLQNPYTKCRIDVEALEKEAGNFFRGGTLHWFAWYECGSGHFDVERSIIDAIKSKIDEKKEDCKSCIITLFHAPGSGGTTLAQRILWDFHKVLPCAQVKVRNAFPREELVDRICLLYKKTGLPVLLMLDGEDEIKVKQLLKSVRGVQIIVLYVKRFPYRIYETQKFNNFWLRGVVTYSEAKSLILKLSDKCDSERKRESLKKLCKDVEKKRDHHLYEFGLTTFSHKFHGIRNYVRGYLQLDDTSIKMLPQHRILAYLSLVYYYAQTSLPRQFFAGLLNKPPNYEVDLDDFPDSAVVFIVSDTNDATEGREKSIRICHYMVAKEILQQLLCRNILSETGEPERLSEGARKNLKQLCLEFIQYASQKKTKQSAGNDSIILILAKTFIFRDNKNIGENEDQIRRKPRLSSVMSDIHSYPPLFTERLQVLEALVEAFPSDPNFHAHLGRFYSYCRQDEDLKAEKCFKTALELCDKQNSKGKDERLKQTYMHVYHMFGTVYQRKLLKYTRRQYKAKPVKVAQSDKFHERLEEIVSYVDLAQDYFRKARDNTPRDQENVFMFNGEISVLLQMCDFVELNCGITHFFTGEETQLSLYIKRSISDIQNLIIECYELIDTEENKKMIQQNILWFNSLFREKTKILEQISVGDDLNSRRLLITAKKLQSGTRDDAFYNLDTITSATDIKDIVRLHEENFNHISVEGLKNGKNDLEIEYKDWIHAIRHRLLDKCYNLEDVLLHVRQWNESLNSPLAKYYLFIITSLIGFGTSEENGKTESLVEAQTLLQELKRVSNCILKPRYPREWLGKTEINGIKRLRSWYSSHDDAHMHQSELATCKGTIFRNNSKLSGFIELHLGNNNCVSVKVFYIPEMASLAGSRFVGTRVEFFMSFTLEHGYEAYHVKKLRKYGCLCSTMVEIVSAEEYGACHNCGSHVQKMEMNAID